MSLSEGHSTSLPQPLRSQRFTVITGTHKWTSHLSPGDSAIGIHVPCPLLPQCDRWSLSRDFRNILIKMQVRHKNRELHADDSLCGRVCTFFFRIAMSDLNILSTNLIKFVREKSYQVDLLLAASLHIFSKQTLVIFDNLNWQFIARVCLKDDLWESIILAAFRGNAWRMNNNHVDLYVSDGDSRVDFTMTRQYLETSA